MNAAQALRHELVDVYGLVTCLGLVDGYRPVKQAGGVIIRCPWHEERTPSCSIRVGRDGTIAARCHGCGATGDALSLVAVARGLDLRRDFGEVLQAGAEIAGRSDLADGAVHHGAPSPRPRPAPERTYPPTRDVLAVLAACVPVANDAEASAMLAARGIDPEFVDDAELVRVLPRGASLPRWASFRGVPWTRTGHRLVLPMFDADGAIRSVRAWRIGASETPKRLPPAGHRASGLVLADAFALAMLRGTYAPRRVLVLEGESDFLAASVGWRHVLAARIGIVSGSWSEDFAARIPDGADVALWTDDDTPGNKYADDIAATLEGRCTVRRAGKELRHGRAA